MEETCTSILEVEEGTSSLTTETQQRTKCSKWCIFALDCALSSIEEIGQYFYQRLSDLFFLDAGHTDRLDWQYSREDDV